MKYKDHKCPECGSGFVPTTEQPQGGTHCSTMMYECGRGETYCIGAAEGEYKLEIECMMKK